MNTRSEPTPDGKGEIGILTHEGRDYASGGGYVADDWAVAYPHEDGTIQLWSGKLIGTWRAVASWPMPLSCAYGSRMYQIEAVIKGRTYTGRGFGAGMIWRGRVKRGRR